jgi:multiple sugar transport system permease protein
MPPIVLSIPFFIFLSTIGLLDSLIGLVVVYIVLLMPIAVWIMVDFFNRVPKELDETALIDGCNPYQAFYKVVLPNSIPGLIVAGMFCIIFGWIDFFFAFILTFTEVQLLPVKVVALNSSITPWWSLSASALISVAPLIIVAFVVERYLSKGNLSGALK